MSDKEEFSALLSATGDVAYEWDMRTDHIEWYGAVGQLFDKATPPDNYDAFYSSVHPDDRKTVFGHDLSRLDRQYRIRLNGNVDVWVHERGAIEAKNGAPQRQAGMMRIIEAPTNNVIKRELSGYDNLTGCLNRGRMTEEITRAIEHAGHGEPSVVYMVVGIDKMSFVNDAVGAEAGDVLLRSVSKRIEELMPPCTVLGRVGGDMFGLLLNGSTPLDAPQITERLLQNFRDNSVVTSVTPLHITVSIGYVRVPDVAKTPSEAMIFAEQALHDARLRGRNLSVEYMDSPERVQENRQLVDLAARIKHAFKNDGFRLAFQPIVDAKTSRPVCYEALVRMFDAGGKPVAAAEFVPAIEQLGMAYELDVRVLDLAVKELELAESLVLCVNVSGLTVAQEQWQHHVTKVLGLRSAIASRIIFEITETAAIMDVGQTRRFVQQVKKLGGRVSLDDFGAGFTSIRHLRTFDLSVMKIDKDLLHDLVGHAEQQHMVRVLIELASGLGLKTVAEGVETEEIAAWLRQAGVDCMQGYYFGKPVLERAWTVKENPALKAGPGARVIPLNVVYGGSAS